MTRLAIAAALVLACAEPAAPPAPEPDPVDALMWEIDDVNRAIRTLYKAGGRVRYLTLVVFTDSLTPPVIITSLKRP